MRLRIDSRSAELGLRLFGQHVRDATGRVGQNAARQLQEYAVRNAPWTDRTGNARRTLTGFCGTDNENGLFQIGVAGQMPYSVFLELAYGQRYAILSPAVHALTADILSELAHEIGQI